MKKVSDVFKSIRYAVGEPQAMQEDLRNWFNPNHPEGDWKRVNSKGEVVGDCAREPGEPKPKCMSRELRNSLTKKEKASAVRRKRKEDPNPERQGAPINVTNKVNEDMEQLDEKNKPTNPELWSRAIAQAKSKFDVYPSAYANGWASKWYKSKGGGWKTVSEAKEKSEYDYEGDMARGQLQSIVNNAQRVHDMLEDNDNLPEWVQSKITLAEDYISTVANYMMSEVDEEVEHIEEGRQSQRHPLEGHEYHKKSDEALVHIAKDAHKAAEAMKSHNTTAENKYRDQANDSATVRHYRKTHGMADWYKKKYGHIKESDASWAAAMEKQRENRLTTGDKKKLDQVRDMLAKEKKPVKKEVMESVKVGDKVSFNHPMTAIPGKTMKKVGTIKKIEGDTVHLKSSTKYGTISYQKKVSELTKEEVVREEVKDEYARKVDKYLKKKHGKDDSQKKLPQGADFAAARRKARLASNGRMDEALSPAIRMQMALQKAREDRERSERNGEAAMAGKFSSGPAKQPTKNHTLVSPKNEEVIVEDNVINKEPKLPFDEPTKKAIGKVKDKSGAVHTPMSRTKDIAKKAARRQAGIKEAADVNDPLDRIDTEAKRSLSKTAGMVKDLATNAKSKAKEKAKKDTFEAEPELSSQIVKQ